MERLTKKTAGGYVLKMPTDKSISDLEIKFNVYDKLGKYEDAEEQGLLLRLPCKVGTKVYEVSNNTDDCCFDCDHFVVGHCCYDYCEKLNVDNPQHAEKPICEKQFLEVIEVVTNLEWIFSHRNMFGKTVFLTKEQAEQALAEMKGV